ncbi:alkylphosphonate utilization protein [Mucilaginibacter sp. 21P]|uniref:alkylphosphonate utilization protein n=1 Tax=Mucilaginibacter sp. 21P TaxID=2778902 RepID=UPI001C573CF4|nr:alkylphosphonate utilization protein [Mucilaginibacter sp. 21P]QXV63823.1 alkylphosphonate utilization protein [Mucilaginibacter sp. 21P]
MNKKLDTQTCQLCDTTAPMSIFTVPVPDKAAYQLAICGGCVNELSRKEPDEHYWHFLSKAMWSEDPGVQVLAWRTLNKLKNEVWAADLLDQLYLEDELLKIAQAGSAAEDTTVAALHRDCLGNELRTGDTVVLTRSLDVKGSQLTAKMGTVVKQIRLVADDAGQVEGKIDGQMIVILTKYIRKQKS